MIGRSGVERLAERHAPRRPRVPWSSRPAATPSSTPAPVPGQDVRITLDMELQQRVQEAFLRYEEVDDPRNPGQDLRVQQMKYPRDARRRRRHRRPHRRGPRAGLLPHLRPQPVRRPLPQARQGLRQPAPAQPRHPGHARARLDRQADRRTLRHHRRRLPRRRDHRVHRVPRHRRPPRKQGRCWVASKFGAQLGAAGVAHHPIP